MADTAAAPAAGRDRGGRPGVDASRADGWHWPTSMTRTDTGSGACELFYVERVAMP